MGFDTPPQRAHEEDVKTEEAAQVQDLMLIGTSMGGARPKAIVEDSQSLWIAKFNRPDDRWNNTRVERAMLELARTYGIVLPKAASTWWVAKTFISLSASIVKRHLPVPYAAEQRPLIASAMAGEVLRSDILVAGFDELLEAGKTESWRLAENRGELMNWVEPFAFSDHPEAVLGVLDRARAIPLSKLVESPAVGTCEEPA